MLCSLCYKVLFILPRLTSHYATARVKLAKHRVEEPQVQPALTFCLTKRKKVTIYLKVGIIPYNLLFTALLNRGAGDNSCYHPANCQQRVITLLSSAKCQERDDNSLL